MVMACLWHAIPEAANAPSPRAGRPSSARGVPRCSIDSPFLFVDEQREPVRPQLIERTPTESETDSIVRHLLVVIGVGAAAFWNAALEPLAASRSAAPDAASCGDAVERQAMQAHVLSQVTDAIVVADVDGRVTSWNTGGRIALRSLRHGRASGSRSPR